MFNARKQICKRMSLIIIGEYTCKQLLTTSTRPVTLFMMLQLLGQKIYAGGFSACVLKAGHLERQTPDNGLTFVDFVAYQGAPEGAVAGEESLVSWWDGTHCRSVDIPEVQ